MQITFDFTTTSPINTYKLTGQNKALYDHLSAGNTITMYQAQSIGVGYLNSRVSDLRNRAGVTIYDRFITINGSQVKEYSLKEFVKN